MFVIPSITRRLHHRRLAGILLVLQLAVRLAACQRTIGGRDADTVPFPDSQIKIRPTDVGQDGGVRSYATGDTQSTTLAIGETVVRGDHKSAIERSSDGEIEGPGPGAGQPGSSLDGARPIATGQQQQQQQQDLAQQPELVLPNYETSPKPAAGPPVYKYTDNVFRVPKRKAKKSYPEMAAAVPPHRKSHSVSSSNRSGAGTGHTESSVALLADASTDHHHHHRQHYPVQHQVAYAIGSHQTAFQLFTNLFDHSNWDVAELRTLVGERCAGHVGLYLRDLRQQRAWALKASDSSGRYGSQYFFGNEFWMGSLTFCDEVNRILRHTTPRPSGARQLEMRFFVAKIAVQFEWLPVSVQPNSILLGQCLPKSCTVEDVTQFLRHDPLFQSLNGNNGTIEVRSQGLTVTHVRPVPGSYNLWSDPKVFALITVVTVLAMVIVYASCGGVTSSGERERYKKATGHHAVAGGKNGAWKLDTTLGSTGATGRVDAGGNHVKLEAGTVGTTGDALEMHKINVESNNNVANGGEQAARDPTLNPPPDPIANGVYKNRKHPARFSMNQILGCFDVGPNAASILSVDPASEDSLSCVHGLRLYSLLWTILVHTYLQLFAVSENRFGRKIAERSFLYQLVGNASFSVDTFFFISGLLIVYLYLKSVSKPSPSAQRQKAAASGGADGNGNAGHTSLAGATRKTGLSILYRYLRLTPVYWFTIVANEVILKWTYDRSVFTPGIIDHITCDRFWWRNILYINNWFTFGEMCMVWSWYLANDMQFYVIAIVLLMLSSRHFRVAAGMLFVCLGGSWLLSMYFSLHYRYTHKVADPFESFDILYDKPWQRIGPYIVGMITGYILYRRPKAPKIVPPLRLLLWTLSTGILIALIFGVWNGELSVQWTALYVSVGHTAWGLALMWITLSCCWGYSSFVNGLLSYRGFFPLSRLAYCTYLIHPVVMMATSFQLEAPMHLQHVLIITAFFGNAVISFLIAFGMSLMFEAPVIKLLKLFFQKPSPQ
ncbi:O-acyltransferase like protein [Anopheles aquasalis]|uniref:O-acyltransferase like protein n=1 Tax=Anopheles aquasalis TaxID=42839 RepID=UPI00215B6064|nr:O-acyltransferase like protein [Anopheles aquasalis]XP_050100836.1 O-acyltransferase like protein [Anopheles aquasalis]